MIDDDGSRGRITELFAELAEASMIEVHFEPGTRYRYLELVRQRAHQLLAEAGERELCQTHLVGWAVAETDDLTYQDLSRIIAEAPNLAAAAHYACGEGDVDAALRITGATFLLLDARNAASSLTARSRRSNSPAPNCINAMPGAAPSSPSRCSRCAVTRPRPGSSPRSC